MDETYVYANIFQSVKHKPIKRIAFVIFCTQMVLPSISHFSFFISRYHDDYIIVCAFGLAFNSIQNDNRQTWNNVFEWEHTRNNKQQMREVLKHRSDKNLIIKCDWCCRVEIREKTLSIHLLYLKKSAFIFPFLFFSSSTRFGKCFH